MADTGVVDLDTDLVGLGRGDFDVLDAQGLTGLPGDGSLASDGLFGRSSGQRRARETFNGGRVGGKRRRVVAQLPRNVKQQQHRRVAGNMTAKFGHTFPAVADMMGVLFDEGRVDENLDGRGLTH